MSAIWKYPLPITDSVTLQMPKHAVVLTVAVQRGQPCLWALVEETMPLEDRRFAVHGTGHPCGEAPFNYIGTFQVMDGELVFHVFEVRP